MQARVAQLGIYNSLAQLLIKITAPGVPDFYQGTELWDLNLVDPDNRRPVDYDARRRALAGLADADPSALLAQRADGRVKMFVANRALAARAERRDVYEQGEYVPIKTAGARRDLPVRVRARRRGSGHHLRAAPDRDADARRDRPAAGQAVWGDTRIEVGDGRTFRDVFTGATLTPVQTDGVHTLPAAAIFERFPVALLVPSDPRPTCPTRLTDAAT